MVVVFFIVWAGIVPIGEISYVYKFNNKSKFISRLSPDDRIEKIENGVVRVNSGPVYFTLSTSRRFEEADLILKYKTSAEIKIIEAGVLADSILWQYDLKPIENKVIDNLSNDWDYLNEGEVIFLQRNAEFQSLKEFLDNPPSLEKIALYNYNLDSDFLIDDYIPDNDIKLFEHDLFGDYQFFTYIKNEDLYFDFIFSDLNKNNDPDPVDVAVYYKDKEIEKKNLLDDGIRDDVGLKKDSRNLKLELKNLPEGAYKIVVRANNDIVTEKIETKQIKMSFINKISLAREDDCGECRKNIITDSKRVHVKTIYPNRLQKILIKELFSPSSFYSDGIDVNETYKQFSSNLIESRMAEIVFEKEGFILAGNGNFSFGFDSFINPKFKKVDINLDVDRQGVEYVLAEYESPKEEGEWKTARVHFDLRNVYSEKGKYSFILSIPGLTNLDEVNDYIEIDEIKIKLKGVGLGEKIKKMIKK